MAEKSKPSFLKKIAIIAGKVFLVLFLFSVGLTLLYRVVPVYYTPLMFIRMVEQVADGKKPKLERDWTPIESISPNMIQAVIASEDNLFLSHSGFDFKGIEHAYKNNKKGKRVKGGSTITQQTAKNVFLYPSRSYVRKALEAYYTVLIELLWSKERIMEVYLNVIETGDGIYGVEAASQAYYHHSSLKLTKSEAALMAVTLPNPRKFSVSNPSSYIKKRQTKILRIMKQIGKQEFH
jgi:monofunctional biosynthetic peptidoglycan transglycosylase